MTTVVITDNKVFCDSQATAGHMITDYDVKKAVNLGHCIVVGAGRWSHVLKFQEWVAECLMVQVAQQEHPYVTVQMPEEMVDDDFMGAVLHQDGTVELFEGCRDSYETSQPVFLGSGGSFAAGAIKAGSSGEDAIKAAIDLDPYSGGEVKVEEFSAQIQQITKEDLICMSKEDIISALYPEESLENLPQQDSDYSNAFAINVKEEIAAICMYTLDEEGIISEVVLDIAEYDDEVIVSSIWLEDNLDRSELITLAKDIGVKGVAHNTKDSGKIINKIIDYVECLIEKEENS